MTPSPQVFMGGKVYFFDPDCYSRMMRVQKTLAHPFQRIDFQDSENYPDGIYTHATAPMDYAVAALSLPMRFLSAQPVDMAGAFIGPLLNLLAILYLWGWCRFMNLRYRWMLLFVAAVSPILSHGYVVGRPDHQCLILLFLTIALTSELTLWSKPSRRWAITNGCAWGLALWTSLYEPLILFIATLILRAALLFILPKIFPKMREWPSSEVIPEIPWRENFIALGAVLLVAFAFDGIRIPKLPKETLEYFNNWSHLIGELRPMSFSKDGIFRFTGWFLFAAPFLLIVDGFRAKSRISFALAVLVLLTGALTLWEQRWGYFIGLTFALCLPWAMRPLKYRLLGYTLFFFTLAPMAAEWEGLLFPGQEYIRFLADKKKDAVLLRDAAEHMVSTEKIPIVAPWWLSPPLAYWSGQPTVGGSSHQSLPGIVDTARIYLTTDPAEAKKILDRRGVGYVVAYEPERAVGSSAVILGKPTPSHSLGEILYQTPNKAPRFLKEVYANQFFKIYRTAP
ncbi:MAG: hypothetical protein ABI615_05935 [Chthoniobacterales bacterium]